ncbi:hypothetical protein M9Y10_041779 [Tritrichomonas musculus]|uniref:Tetraspanin family protein n=1 Tax=Tritrichomonas musculus TaxID=1915356 RepID=A0ABR2K5X0_9EUKA
MPFEIQDLNFGIKTWYLQPTFFVKIGSALISFILMIILFVVISRSSDSIYKAAIGRSECICFMLLAILLLLTVICFLFYFYKIYPDYSIYLFFASAGSSIFYVLIFFICIIAFCTKGKCKKYTQILVLYCQNNYAEKVVTNFLSKYKTDITSPDFNSIVEKYVKGRTTQTSNLLMPVSLIWIILIIFLFFTVLFESKDSEDGRNSNVMHLRPNVDA